MNEAKNYRMVVALLRFKAAYHELVEASISIPDYDISENYPFYLLDYEQIESAVNQWCTVHAAKLMKELPDRVDNAACVECKFFREGIGANGQCKGQKELSCTLYPFIPFSREMALPVLSVDTDTSNLSDDELHFLYLRHMDNVKK